jgi:hypothetical protein
MRCPSTISAVGSKTWRGDVMKVSNTPRARVLGSTLLLLIALAGCGGNDNDPDPPVQNPPPETDLTWDEGNWDELNWQ